MNCRTVILIMLNLIFSGFVKAQPQIKNKFGIFTFKEISKDFFSENKFDFDNKRQNFTPLWIRSDKEEIQNIEKNSYVMRLKDSLIITTHDSIVKFIDYTIKDNGFCKNMYSGFIDKINSHLIGQTWWEYHSALLINGDSGKTTKVGNSIYVLNDINKLLTIYSDDLSCEIEIDLFDFEESSDLKLLYKVKWDNCNLKIEDFIIDKKLNIRIKSNNGKYYQIIRKIGTPH